MVLNFHDKKSITDFLKRDKHKLLEGMVVEELFMQDIAISKNWYSQISKGWWSIRNPLKFQEYMLFQVSSRLPISSDIEIYKVLLRSHILFYHVLLVENDLYFLDLTSHNLETNIQKSNYICESDFLKVYNKNSKTREIPLADEKYRDNYNQERAISFLESLNLIKEVALQRYFANYFLTVCLNAFPVNLDAFVIFKDGPAVIEIKFKYPDKKGNYGINKGQAVLFNWLIDSGFSVHHYIASNPTFKKTQSIFDVLTSDEVKDECKWKHKKLNISDLQNTHGIAPKETNITGEAPVNFIPILASSFTNTKILVGKHIDTTVISKNACLKKE